MNDRLLARALIVATIATAAGMRNAAAANRAIIFGGNCDGPVAGSTFLYNMASTSAALSKKGWDVVNLYDGKNARCSLSATDQKCSVAHPPPQCCPVGVSPALWNVSSYAKIAGINPDQVRTGSRDELIQTLRSSLNLKPGDQLLLVFETHGSESAPKQRLGHGLCTSGFGTVGDQKTEFTDQGLKRSALYQALDELKTKGIKMGFIDDSCYSGGSISNFAKYGCVVTATTAHRPATELPVSQGLIEFLNGTDWGHGNKPVAAPAAPLELQPGRISLADLYLKSLFTGNSLLYSARLREISGFTPGNQFAEDFAGKFIPADLGATGEELRAPDYDVNDSSAWGNAACVEQIDQQISGLSDLIRATDAADGINPERESGIIAAYTNDLKQENHTFATRAFDQNIPPQQIVADLNSRLREYKDFMSRYSALAEHEKELLTHVLNSRFPARFHFDGPLAGAEDAFWAAATAQTGSRARLTDPKTGKITNPTLWRNLINVMDLSPGALLDRQRTSASIICERMKRNGYPGVTPQFQEALAEMMAGSLEKGWNGLSPAERQDQLKTYNDYVDTQIKEGQLAGDFAYKNNFRSTVNLRLAQAQAFHYLGYREYLESHAAELTPSQKIDYDSLKGCADFTLSQGTEAH